MSDWQRDHVTGVLDLVKITTTGGDFHFLVGIDGVFTDINGQQWIGSTLVSTGSLETAIDGIAPAGALTLSFFQDPEEPDLIDQVKALGLDYIRDQPVTFYHQPLLSHAELYAPTMAPVQWLHRTMKTLTFSANGAQDRSISVTFESWAEDREGARRIALNTEGHAKILGVANPSLEFMPTDNFEEEKLFG